MCCSFNQRLEFEWMRYELYMKLCLALLIFAEGMKQLTELESFCIVASGFQASGFSGSSISFFHMICIRIKENCFQTSIYFKLYCSCMV